MDLPSLLAMAYRVAGGPSHVDSMELGEAAGMDMAGGADAKDVARRIQEALLGDDEVPSEADLDAGFWSGFGRGKGLEGESRDVVEELHVKPGTKALSELKAALSGAGISLGLA